MIDNGVTWRGTASISENAAAPQLAKNSDPDNPRSASSRGAAFEAYIFEVAGAKKQTAGSPVQNGRQMSYSKDGSNQDATSTAQGDELPTSPGAQSTAAGLQSEEKAKNFSSISSLYGNGRGSVAGNSVSRLASQYQAALSGNNSSTTVADSDVWRSGRVQVPANTNPMTKSGIIQAQSSPLSNDDSEDLDAPSQVVSVTNAGRNQVALTALRRASISNALMGPAGHHDAANTSQPSLLGSPAAVAGQVQSAATNSAGTDPSCGAGGAAVGNTQGWRGARMQSAGANAKAVTKLAAGQAQGSTLSNDGSEDQNGNSQDSSVIALGQGQDASAVLKGSGLDLSNDGSEVQNRKSHGLNANDPGRNQGASAAPRGTSLSNSSPIPAKNHDEGNASPSSPTVSPAVIAVGAAQSQSAATNSLDIDPDPSSAAQGVANDIVSTALSGLSSPRAMTGDERDGGSNRRDDDKGLVFGSGSGPNGAPDLLSSAVGGNATLGDFKSEGTVPANLASALPDTIQKISTSHLTDGKEQAASEIATPTIGLSVIGQATSFAPPVTSFSIQQVADPIISACWTKAPDDSATGTSAPANALVKTLEIRLSPESLGVVTVKINLSGDALEIQVVADHQETLRLLKDNKDVLSQSIQSSGYKLDALTLEGNAGQSGSLGGQTSQGQGHHFGFQSSPQGSSTNASQQGENRSRDQSRLEKGREGTSGEPSGSRTLETGADNRSGAIYV